MTMILKSMIAVRIQDLIVLVRNIPGEGASMTSSKTFRLIQRAAASCVGEAFWYSRSLNCTCWRLCSGQTGTLNTNRVHLAPTSNQRGTKLKRKGHLLGSTKKYTDN